MANVQKENGYTATANELVEAICNLEISGACHRVLRFIERKTYGYSKKEDPISYTQFENGTGLYRNTVNESLDTLVEMGVIIIDRTGFINKYRINKDYDTWTSNQKRTSNQKLPNSNQNLTKTSNQKRTYKNKKQITKTISDKSQKDMVWNKKSDNDDDLPVIGDDGEIEKTEEARLKEQNEKVTALIEWAEKVRKKKFIDTTTQRKMIHDMRKAKISPDVIKKTYLDLLHSEYWQKQDRLPDFKTVFSNLKNKK